MLPNLRKCSEISEFLELLLECQSNKKPFLVWQSFKSKKVLGKASLSAVRLANKKVELKVRLDRKVEGAAGRSLYFYQEDAFVLFKCDILRTNVLEFEMEVAGKVFLLEKRARPRMEFENAQYFLQIATYKENQEKLSKSQVVLSNIGPFGFAFVVNATKAERFQVGDKIVLYRVESVQLPRPLLGSVVHTTVLGEPAARESGSRRILIGSKFDEESPIIAKTMQALVD